MKHTERGRRRDLARLLSVAGDQVRRYAGGSILTFIHWVDEAAAPLLDPRNDAA